MSPLPNRPLQPPKSYAAESAAASSAETPENTTSTEPTTQRPLMRPVARPQPPAPEAKAPVTQASEPADSAPAASASSEPSEAEIAEMRQQPIPAPSEPMQYRAIGLLRGRYKPTDEQFTRGEMITSDGTPIEAVLLGRVMSLVKNHLDLEQEHLWVVYPRTREKQEDLHVQIVGVWEPEKLSKPEDEDEQDSPGYLPSSEVEDNYFSIRGEIIFHAPESQSLIVKIQQAPRKKDDRAKMFKLKLNGVLTGKTIGYFWELNVRREGANLVVQDGRSIGMIPPKKRPKGAPMGRGGPSGGGGRFGGKKPFRPRPGGGSGVGGGRPQSAPPQPQQQRRGEPLPKPVKRKAAPEDSPPETNVTNEA